MSKRYTQAQLAQFARQAGFPEQDVPTIVAIAMGESSGDPRAHNPDASTGDNSYGLMQINMLGQMGADRRAQFGLSSNEELFDPVKNFAAAKTIYDSQGLGAWGAYNNQSYKDFMPGAREAANSSLGQSPLGVGGGDNSDYLAGLGYITDNDGNVTGIDPIKYLENLRGGGGTGTGDTYNTVFNLLNPQDKKEDKENSILKGFKNSLLQQAIESSQKGGYDPMKILRQQGFLNPNGYLKYVNQ